MLREDEANEKLNVKIHPIAKARAVAECERRTIQHGTKCTLGKLVSDYFMSLRALPKNIEETLQRDFEAKVEQLLRDRRQKRKAKALLTSA